MAKSNKPLIWSLFASGGMVAAMVLPVLVLITGILAPLGLLPEGSLSYARMHALISHPVGLLFLFTVISLSLWHASHRILLSLHDLGLHQGRQASAWICYGGAATGTIASLYYLLQI